MPIARPPGMPISLDNCWGKKYQDGDPECRQCKFKDTCRPKMFESLSAMPTRPPSHQSLPIFPSAPATGYPRPVGTVPMPPSPPSPPSAPPASVPVRNFSPSVPQPPPTYPVYDQQTQQTYQAQPQHYVLPNPHDPNPMAPMYRPGAPGPAYYFNQYPEESVAARLTKNVLLRGMEAIFSELMYFFRHWTWPPSR